MKNALVINNLIWIDEKIENKENIKFSENLKKKFDLNLIKCDSLEKGFDEILKINFELVYIIVSGRLFENYIIKLKKIYNILKTIPITMIYTSEKFKNELIGKVMINYNPYIINITLNDSFMNPGGICTKPVEIYNFINNFNNMYYNELNNLNQSSFNENISNLNVNSNNFFFEKIESLDNLILPTIYSKLFVKNNLNDDEINNILNSFLKIDNDKNLKTLISSLIKIEGIPLEIKAKFVFKIFISHSKIFEILNNNFKQSLNSKFSAFIYLMYEGLNKKALNSDFSNDLYKLYFVNKSVFKTIENKYLTYSKNKNFELPFGFIYFKHFIDFDKDKKNVLDLKKIYNYYTFEPEYSFVLLEIKKNNNYNYYTYNLDSKGFTDPKNEKIYFFPFTPLIVEKISYENLGEFKIKKLILNYIDLYDEKINLFSFNDYYLNDFIKFGYSRQIINNPHIINTNESINDLKQNIKIHFQITKENYDPPPPINAFN